MSQTDGIAKVLDALYNARSQSHLKNDPLSFCHRYPDPVDREIVAVLASSFAYGSVVIILRTLETVLAELGSSPRRYLERFEPSRGLSCFAGFRHRFNDGRDLTALLWGLRQMLESAGSVEAYFMRGYDVGETDIGEAVNRYCRSTLELDYSPVFGGAAIPSGSAFPFLFPSPSSGSACKRLCMMLRWLVRAADGVDLGLWKGIRPSQLVIPVDTHVSRICRYLGLTGRKNADWKMAIEITRVLRDFDPEDPVKYDFAIAHLGISEGCDGKSPDLCTACTLALFCARKPVN